MADTSKVKDSDLEFLRLALTEARKCVPTPTAFCVGCVITVPRPSDNEPVIISTGFSRELEGNTHAEANALEKARNLTSESLSLILGNNREKGVSVPTIEELLATANIYTTLEPCSIRTSGLAPCADALIAARVKRCFIGAGEPDDFVNCEGARKLREARVEVVWVKGMEGECLEVARRKSTPDSPHVSPSSPPCLLGTDPKIDDAYMGVDGARAF